MATVKIIKEVEIDDSIASNAIIDIFHNYSVCSGMKISYYDLDAENQIRFLETLQEQLLSEITERIDLIKENFLKEEDYSKEKEAAATN